MDSIEFVVTGFGPFADVVVNPSDALAQALPAHVAALALPNVTCTAAPTVEVSVEGAAAATAAEGAATASTRGPLRAAPASASRAL